MEQTIQIPALGDKFPAATVQTTQGVLNLPEALEGKWTVLFSHPGDFTPVCTTEFVEFATRAADFAALNTQLIGLSVDQVFAHIKWVEWIEQNLGVKIPFPVIADELGRLSTKLGMLHPNKGTNTIRAVYIIDDKGVIRLMLFYPQETGRNVAEVLRVLKALQVADKNAVAMPENWPNNRLIGDECIIPPASSEALAADRLAAAKRGEITAKDWWFCHKKVVA